MKENIIKPTNTDAISACVKQVKEMKYTPKYAKYIDEKGKLVEIVIK